MKALAHSHVWWPELDREVEDRVKACMSCQAVKHAPAKAPLHPWAWTTAPWERIHVDFAGPVAGRMLFIAVDAHSKWPEVCVMNSTTAGRTVAVLREMFARNGILCQVVFDNGPQFISEEFQHFLTSNRVKHLRCAPYHPSSNEAVERLVQTVKQALKSGQSQGVSLETTLATFLMQYQSTPHATTGVSPASLFFGHPLRNRLDLLKPDVAARVCNKQTDQKNYHDRHSRVRQFAVGQTVMALNMREGPKWRPGVVVEQLGPC